MSIETTTDARGRITRVVSGPVERVELYKDENSGEWFLLLGPENHVHVTGVYSNSPIGVRNND